MTGSDLKSSPTTQRLAAGGVAVRIGHDAAHVAEAELVTMSTAIAAVEPRGGRGPAAGASRCCSRAEATAAVAACRRCVAVSGTHGKTTTTSMLALILVEAGLRPSFLIGGDINEIGTNAVWDTGEWLVIEADESDGTFLALDPEIAVVTNVEADHLDFYGGFDAAGGRLRPLLHGPARRRGGGGRRRRGRRAGPGATGPTWWGRRPTPPTGSRTSSAGPTGCRSPCTHGGADARARIAIPVTGANIARNAAVATVAALRTGAAFDDAVRAFARFAGVARRFEWRGEAGGVRFVDDYAHLPTEVRGRARGGPADGAAAARGGVPTPPLQPDRGPRGAVRRRLLGRRRGGGDRHLRRRGGAAAGGDGPAGGRRRDGRATPISTCATWPAAHELRAHLAGVLRPGDLCLTLGAGDLTSLPDEMLAAPRW